MLSPFDFGYDEFPSSAGPVIGGGGGIGVGGGIGGGQILTPGLYLSPSGIQNMPIGTKLCFEASGIMALPQEARQNAVIDVGCSISSNGTWIKNCGTNGNPDAECLNSKKIYVKQPFFIQGKNTIFSTPGTPINNNHLFIGVKSEGGYYFFWQVMKYCASTPGYCSTSWMASCIVIFPDGSTTTLENGFIEQDQVFRIKSDGTRIIWEYTTHGNEVYNRAYMNIPENCGDFNFFVNALYLGNTWSNLTTFRSSYQGPIDTEDFIWSSDCLDALEINGKKACYTPTIPGSCNICVSALTMGPVCTTVISSPLYLNPTNAECGDCGILVDCLNIPTPTVPTISFATGSDSLIPLDSNDVRIIWEDSISFTNGLHYVVYYDGSLIEVLDSSVIFRDLSPSKHTFKVKAVDDCGESIYSNTLTVTIS